MKKNEIYHANDFFPALSFNKKYSSYFVKSEEMGIGVKAYVFCMAYVMYYNKLDPVTAYGQAYHCEGIPRGQKEKEMNKLLRDEEIRSFILYLKDKLGLTDLIPIDWVIDITKDIIIDATTLVDEYDRTGQLTGKKTMRDRALAQKTLAMIGGWLKFNTMNLALSGELNSPAFIDIPKTMTAAEATKVYTDNINKGGNK